MRVDGDNRQFVSGVYDGRHIAERGDNHADQHKQYADNGVVGQADFIYFGPENQRDSCKSQCGSEKQPVFDNFLEENPFQHCVSQHDTAEQHGYKARGYSLCAVVDEKVVDAKQQRALQKNYRVNSPWQAQRSM